MAAKPKTRCGWLNLKNPLYVEYHDKEWGVPVHQDQKHFEMLTLEGAQAGLSWETVLNKRENYRRLFSKFDPKKVAKFTPAKITSLLKEEGIIRNRLKVESTVSNAKAFLKIQKEFGSFDKYIWQFVNHQPIINNFKNLSEYPTKTKISDTISKDLKKRGFRFVGSTIIYAYMQAIGMVNDHRPTCFKRQKKRSDWVVYVIRCADDSLYTGVTIDIKKRFQAHQSSSKGAKYLRGKGPLTLAYTEWVGDKTKAYSIERLFKMLSKSAKEKLLTKGNLQNTLVPKKLRQQ